MVDGTGVDVALVDSGVTPVAGLGNVVHGPDFSAEARDPDLATLDTFGHGTHLAGIIAGRDPVTGFSGVAPGARLVSVMISGAEGETSLIQVLSALDWVRRNRRANGMDIRVVNLSLGVEDRGGYRRDVLAWAVERLWQEGIAVVAAAGNNGLFARKLDIPAADPFVIAAGASETFATADPADDRVASFSSRSNDRPPDVVAPGTRIVSLRVPGSVLDEEFPAARVGDAFFRGSGTSQAAAVVTRAGALGAPRAHPGPAEGDAAGRRGGRPGPAGGRRRRPGRPAAHTCPPGARRRGRAADVAAGDARLDRQEPPSRGRERGVGGPPLVRSPLVRSPVVGVDLGRPPLVGSFVDRRIGRLTRATLGALIAATAFAAIALWLGVVRDLLPYEADVRIPWWALAAGFAATEVFVVHAHVRGSAHSLTLSEIPLVLGLLLADPADLVLAMVAGPAVVLLFTRGHGTVRLLFNLAQFGLTAALATIVMHALVPAPALIGPAVWGAAFAAVLASSFTAAVLVFCAIGMSEGSIASRRLAGMLGADLLVALTNTSVALSVATVVAEDVRAGWLLVPPATILLLAYRAYVSERAKHRSLEFLYGVARSLSRGRGLEPELLDLLRRTRTSFRVRVAELVLLPGEPGVGALRTALGRDGREEAMVDMAHGPAAALRAAVEDEHAVLVERDRCAPELGRYLAERGIEQALVAPVHGETQLKGVMVLGDRVGATTSFTDEDLRLLETLANHAGLSLEFDRLERQAQSDPLTGLANRTLFIRRVEASLARGSGTVTVLFLDLDDFKAVNDRTGHAAGDALLVAVAGRIEASVRPDDLGARMGGDEFAVLLEDVDDHHGEHVAGRILDLLAESVVVEGASLWVRSSVGIASAAAGSLDAAELLHRADVAMYRAKEAGKSQVRVWCPEMQPAGVGAVTGHEELALAVERAELIAHFQPVISLDGGEVVAVEALARWNHPRRGLLGPASFMPAAESGGLVAAVDRAVLDQACAAAAAGAVPVVHVNMSAPSLEVVGAVLEATGLEPARLVLELSERALAASSSDELSGLRSMGVRIAFDDFGSGPGALELLRERPVDILKIAKPFVDGAGRAAHDRALLSMLLQLGAMFGVRVLAEGIEREDQREALVELGCELGQGYLLGRPVPQSAVGGVSGATDAARA